MSLPGRSIPVEAPEPVVEPVYVPDWEDLPPAPEETPETVPERAPEREPVPA